MSFGHSERRVSAGQSKSERLTAELHVIECGHGDTLLIHLPGKRWALVDCHLPEGRVRAKFFDFVRKRGINRLDLVFLTHAHRDHFHGMAEVIEHFTAEGRSIGYYCDSGVDPGQVRDLLRRANRPRAEIREYERLHRRLDELIGGDVVQYLRVDENTEAIRVSGHSGEVELLPLGPEPSVLRRMLRGAISCGEAVESLNLISLVLLLGLEDRERHCAMLLAGDAERDALTRSLASWTPKGALGNGRGKIRVLKIPHHGSVKCHSPEICRRYRAPEGGVAVISVGTRFRVLPDREVMRDFLESGWTILTTTKRLEGRRRDSALTLWGERRRKGPEVRRNDIRVRWRSGEGLDYGPEDCAVTHDELRFYDSAAEPVELRH